MVIRKNVSAYNRFMGMSDCECIHELQQMANKIFTKAYKKALKAGSIMTKPLDSSFQLSDEDVSVAGLKTPQEASLYRSILFDFFPEKDLAILDKLYYMAKSIMGITDTYQGKSDPTAQSGRAKEILVAQSAGRQLSKRVMKNAAYARRYELMFKYMLAYSDEPRVYSTLDENGMPVESVFNRYDFLVCDAFGNWTYDDNYLFSVDESGVSGENKLQLLADLRTDFAMGAYGDPRDPQTMLRYWREKEIIGYPNAKRNVTEWEEINRSNAKKEGSHELL